MAAFSKINLFLEVMGKRPDGYHEIVTVMQRLELCDTLAIRRGGLRSPAGTIQLESTHPTLPTDDTNLVVKAAKLLIEKYNITQPIQIKLDKHIPIGAGLGGGSSDCAAALIGINRLFELNIPDAALMELGAALGADVPFCIFANSPGNSGTAIAKGIGEILTPLEPHPQCCVVLACPSVHVSTKEIFDRLVGSAHSTSCAYDVPPRVPPSYVVPRGAQGHPPYEGHIAKNFYNRFTQITSEVHPQITALITGLRNHGAYGASMTGTGATVFAYFDNENNARTACDKLQQQHEDVKFFVTKTI